MIDWTLYQGDCLDAVTGMATLADGSVDHVITDPPYDEWTHGKQRRGRTDYAADQSSGCARRTVDLGFEPLSSEAMSACAAQFARLARRWVVVFCALEMLSEWRAALDKAGLEYVRCCIWHRINGSPQFRGDRPAQACEAIVVAHRTGRKAWNGGGRSGFYEYTVVRNDRVHTTQKPLGLMEALIRDFTDRGELVCDPFAGSGTTGVAALRHGRRFVGWERDEKYHEVATRRLATTREQLALAI